MATGSVRNNKIIGANFTYGNLYRSGHVVRFNWNTTTSTQFSDGQEIVTIPDGFRPHVTYDGAVFSTAGEYMGTLRISTDGKVTPVFGVLKAGVLRFSFVYLTY